jgi:hypothetical protein
MASTSPAELPVGSTPIFSGPLHKQSQWIKDWRLRFFKLYTTPSGPRLYFSSDEHAPPHGMIDLRGCLTVKSADDKTGKPNSFEVATTDKTFFMYATSSAKKDEVRPPLRARRRHSPNAPPRLTRLCSPRHRPSATHQWVGALGRAIVLASRSFRAPDDDDDDDDDDEEESAAAGGGGR